MLSKVMKSVFGSRNDRIIKKLKQRINQINQLESSIQALSDDELKHKTEEFRERFAAGETLEQLLNEAFAVCREAAVRTLGMRHYDVQLIGGMILNNNQITEMRTGEGKTLVATLPAYLNAISGKGVHIVTVNDYLAERDAEWMGRIYNFLGLSVGVVLSTMDYTAKRDSYRADITYGTNNQFGFDYMHDNLCFSLDERVQRELNFAIVDEVDSILIDEARTPLIISGQASDSSELYSRINSIVPHLKRVETEDGPGDYSVDEKSRQAYLTEEGHDTAERLMTESGLLNPGESLYDAANIALVHHLNAGLRAHALYARDVDYIVKDGSIVIVDEFTGRTMPGRRWSEGLHQAIEAKEGVNIQHENQTIASITFQNYFRLYDKLAGMTGTADTEAFEFQQIYGLEVVVVPTNQPMIREDMGDLIYLTTREKFEAIIEDIRDCVERGQPVLVGTTSVETSEYLSGLLDKVKIKHQILNAKQHEREAKIIADAGTPGTVTIATNMAGRGTDIVLGGNLEVQLGEIDEDNKAERERLTKEWQQRHAQVIEAGGLHIIGTERHESRRVDNQLRGRSGRQGDPGSSRFYLSLEDPLLRIFAGERINRIMVMLKMPEGEAIEHGMVTRSIETAQRKVEARNFDIRKQLLEYDDVANDQRRTIYGLRNELLDSQDVSARLSDLRAGVVGDIFRQSVPEESVEEQWDIPMLEATLRSELRIEAPVSRWLEADPDLNDETLLTRIIERANETYAARIPAGAETAVRQWERYMMLQILDAHWREHLAALDHLRQGIHLRGYAQKNPKQEYKREAFELFGAMLEAVKLEVTKTLCLAEFRAGEEVPRADDAQHVENVRLQHADYEEALAEAAETKKSQPVVRPSQKVGRNEPCPCGSGKKYKHCHGKLA